MAVQYANVRPRQESGGRAAPLAIGWVVGPFPSAILSAPENFWKAPKLANRQYVLIDRQTKIAFF